MTWSQQTRAAGIIFVALIVGSFLVLGNQRQAFALGNPDLPGVPECADLIDNDNDGQMDFIPVVGGDGAGPDSDCEDIFDDSEGPSSPVTAQCADGIDNDGDTLVDLNDPGCANGSDNDETNAPVLGACEDGIDNDTDGFTDTIDPNCHTDGDATNPDSYDADREETGSMPACWDGIDNDQDGTTDWGLPSDTNRDLDCSTPTDNDETGTGGGGGGGNENTLQLCTDTTDNDSDELIDLADPDCASFMPKLVVRKVVINDNSGTSTVSSFPLFITKTSEPNQVVSGATTTVSVGTWTVTETSNSGYTATFSGDCNASGQVTLVAGETKTCVVTNNDVTPGGGSGGHAAQCADGIDNDGDELTDEADPGCHNDNNENNPFSYQPQDDNESDLTPPPSGGGGGGGGGGGNGPISTSGGGFGGNGPVGLVLGASTTTLPAGCTALINSYMRMGKKGNDPAEVKKLQKFLNEQVGSNLPITGFFGPLTDAAVRKFQSAHTSDVLTPWGIDVSTGFVYQTTQRWINLMHCKTLSIPVPVLTPFKEN